MASPNWHANAAMLHDDLAKIEPDPMSINAVNNRLEKLRKLGLVTRTRSGKHWFYRASFTPQNSQIQRHEVSSGMPGSEAAERGTSDNIA